MPLDKIIVTATRTPGLIRDEPLRVEAVPAEEIEENLTVQPGNLSSESVGACCQADEGNLSRP